MIIVLTQCFPSRLGGIESLISNLALELSKSQKVIVFADRHHVFYDIIYDNEHKDKILVRRISGLKFFRRRRKIKEVRPFIESKQVKLIIADTWKSIELGIDYFNMNKIPTICLAHGNELLSNDEKKYNRIKNILNKTTSIIANSLYTKKLVENLITSNVMVDYVYPGANDLRHIKEHIFIEITGNPIIITLARLEKRKGHIAVIYAIKQLLLEFPNLKYIIAGEGPEKITLEKIIKKNNLEENIIFAGLVNDAQKKFLFQKADLMVMPTLDESKKRSVEGFGIAYIEAAFFGVPSIASNIGGTSEAVIDKSTGIIINSVNDLYGSIKDLLSDKNKRIFLGQNAQKRSIDELNWENVCKNYLKAFSKVVPNLN